MERLKNRTLYRTVNGGEEKAVGLKFKPTIFNNISYIVAEDEEDLIVGILHNNKTYLLGDKVEIRDDCGYITPGISKPGMGRIACFQYDDTGHFFGIQMDSGEFGFVKVAQIHRIIS